jgi:hypothetical protein
MPPSPATPHHAPLQKPANSYDRMEWAGAFGDLGTLIPFITAYIGVLGLNPFGILLAFGAAMVACGLYYRTPFPVQPPAPCLAEGCARRLPPRPWRAHPPELR